MGSFLLFAIGLAAPCERWQTRHCLPVVSTRSLPSRALHMDGDLLGDAFKIGVGFSVGHQISTFAVSAVFGAIEAFAAALEPPPPPPLPQRRGF
jgi:hypothetical protein